MIGTADTDGRSLAAEWYSGQTWPIDPGDWTSAEGSNAHVGTLLHQIVPGRQNAFALTNLDSIDPTGFTGLRVHISDSEAGPSGANDLAFAAFEHPNLPPPTLLVSYTISG